MCIAKCSRNFILEKGTSPIAKAECHCVSDVCNWEQRKSATKRVLDNVGLANLEFTADGFITPKCVEINKNNEILCQEIGEIENGIIHCSDGMKSQSKCKVRCNRGFLLKSDFNVSHSL